MHAWLKEERDRLKGRKLILEPDQVPERQDVARQTAVYYRMEWVKDFPFFGKN